VSNISIGKTLVDKPHEQIHLARGQGCGRHVVAVGNLKGGTGKSTVSVNLACALAQQGRRVVIVDNDPQGTAAAWAAQEKLPVRCLHRPLDSFAQVEPWINAVQALRAQHDVVVIDLPASVAPALGAALLMATVILVPTSPSRIDLEATRRVLVHIRRAREERGARPPAVFIVPDRVVDLERGLDGFATRLADLGEPMAPPIRHSSAFDLAFERGEWVGGFRPGTSAHHEVQALAELVAQRLAVMAPSPWPALPEAKGRPEAVIEPASARSAEAASGGRRHWLQRLFGSRREPMPTR
jgi:chromosome partitioning protein